jgi:hypothetical protein
LFPPNIVEDALEAEKLWAENCGTDDVPSNTQMRTWIRSCGMPALRHAIPLAGWKKRKCAESGQPIPPDGLERYASAACKRKSLELGFVRPEQTQPETTQRRFVSTPIPVIDTPRRAPQRQEFKAPDEWLEHDDVERYVPAEWVK